MPVFDRDAVRDALKEEAAGLLRELYLERKLHTYYAGQKYGWLHYRPAKVNGIVTRLRDIENELRDRAA